MSMKDIETAKATLIRSNCSLALAKDGKTYEYNGRGISPLIAIIDSEADFCGFSAADKIIGKAAALLLCKIGVVAFYGQTMSVKAVAIAKKYGVDYSYGTLADKISNARGDSECPMEKAVSECDDKDDALSLLRAARIKLATRRGNADADNVAVGKRGT